MVKRIVLWFFGIILLAAVLSIFLPDHAHVERRITIKAVPAAVFPFVNNPRNTEKWSPWLERDRNATLTYSGAAAGKGAKLAWRSDVPDVGAGTLEIIESKPNELVRVALSFEGHGDATSYYKLKPENDGTSVTWGFDSMLGWNPVKRYMGLMFEAWIGADYERGLQNLKSVLEGG